MTVTEFVVPFTLVDCFVPLFVATLSTDGILFCFLVYSIFIELLLPLLSSFRCTVRIFLLTNYYVSVCFQLIVYFFVSFPPRLQSFCDYPQALFWVQVHPNAVCYLGDGDILFFKYLGNYRPYLLLSGRQREHPKSRTEQN